MAENKGTTRQDFPEVRDKIVEIVELSVEPGYYGITIRFQDKTKLNFSIEPCVFAFPVYSDITGGEDKPLKRYKPISSKLFKT